MKNVWKTFQEISSLVTSSAAFRKKITDNLSQAAQAPEGCIKNILRPSLRFKNVLKTSLEGFVSSGIRPQLYVPLSTQCVSKVINGVHVPSHFSISKSGFSPARRGIGSVPSLRTPLTNLSNPLSELMFLH